MKIKMIVTDLDGTLLNTANTISKANIEAFQKAKAAGIIPVVATGRIDREGWVSAEAIGATEYMLSSNGGMVKDYLNNRVLFEDAMSESMVHELIQLLDTYCNIFVQVHTAEGCVCTEKTFPVMLNAGWADEYIRQFRDQQIVVEDIEDYLKTKDLSTVKFVISSVDFPMLDEIQRRVGDLDGFQALRPMDYCLECIPEWVNKAVGLRALCKAIDIPENAVMVIGDSDNDLELFETNAFKVAMGNAYDCIKKRADVIVASNDADGVAEAILKYAL